MITSMDETPTLNDTDTPSTTIRAPFLAGCDDVLDGAWQEGSVAGAASLHAKHVKLTHRLKPTRNQAELQNDSVVLSPSIDHQISEP